MSDIIDNLNFDRNALPTAVLVLGLAAGLTACGGTAEGAGSQSADYRDTSIATTDDPSRAEQAPACSSCGEIRAIETVKIEGEGTGAGAAIGAVVGGLIGNQVGGGSGKDAATAAGVIGGAVAGNSIESNRNDSIVYDVVVEMEESGLTKTIRVPALAGLYVGQDVRVEANTIYPS